MKKILNQKWSILAALIIGAGFYYLSTFRFIPPAASHEQAPFSWVSLFSTICWPSGLGFMFASIRRCIRIFKGRKSASDAERRENWYKALLYLVIGILAFTLPFLMALLSV